MPNQLAPYHENVTIADLSERQAKFVQAYLECGHQRDGAIQAAIQAGYGSNDRAQAKSRAYDLLHNGKVLAALRDEICKKFSAGAVIGANVLVELAQTAQSEKVRLSSAVQLIDRGFGPIMSRNTPAESKERSVEDFLANLKIVEPPPDDDDDPTVCRLPKQAGTEE
jgi:phage terminase small subunit